MEPTTSGAMNQYSVSVVANNRAVEQFGRDIVTRFTLDELTDGVRLSAAGDEPQPGMMDLRSGRRQFSDQRAIDASELRLSAGSRFFDRAGVPVPPAQHPLGGEFRRGHRPPATPPMRRVTLERPAASADERVARVREASDREHRLDDATLVFEKTEGERRHVWHFDTMIGDVVYAEIFDGAQKVQTIEYDFASMAAGHRVSRIAHTWLDAEGLVERSKTITLDQN
jgi:hypothetical protein